MIEQSKLGKKVKKEKADIGDLIFFKTTRRKVISHVGMVVANYNGEIKFIHASSSKGVTISSLEQSYFKKKFVKIKRVIL
ncbi:MAG: C40 family peptidase [Flavobacterium sp.]|nr:C40 family peptidase [Flavobacterium sp.]